MLTDFLINTYFWNKALHIISMVAWMAGLFYLPRLFIYHVDHAPPGTELALVFKTMERRLLRIIMFPAMISTWIFGVLLALTPGIVQASSGWFHVKVLCVVFLTWFHHWLARRCDDFAEDKNYISSKKYRIMNELPTIILVIVVTMVVVKPF